MLFDFETAEFKALGVNFTGSRTTGRLRGAAFSKVKQGKTFIQKSIDYAVGNFISIRDKVKGKQTITYRPFKKEGENEVSNGEEITFSTNNPSVTGVLSNVRQYIVYCLLKNGLSPDIKPFCLLKVKSCQNVPLFGYESKLLASKSRTNPVFSIDCFK